MIEKEYITVSGDMWDMLAKKLTGSEKNMTFFMEQNDNYIHEAILSAGHKLKVPSIPHTETQLKPPWSR